MSTKKKATSKSTEKVESMKDYVDPFEQQYRERTEKRAAAIREAEDATADDLVGRKPNRFTVAVNRGTDDEPDFVKITFTALPRAKFDAMLDEHTPEPTEDEPNPDENKETFGPVLLSACMTTPKISEEQAQTIWDEWSREEALTLYTAAVHVNMGSRMEVLGNV